MLDPSDPRAPKYWMWETTGILAATVKAYLAGNRLTIQQIALMRAYLLQWVASPVWAGGELDLDIKALIKRVDEIKTQEDIRAAIHAGLSIGIDPL